jgi:aspartyl-tRNA(Asn)/glutamyl-tRNA(Gln) amidotransferase subunit A
MVPRGQGFPAILHDFEVAGPIARSVADVILAMKIIAGPAWQHPDAHVDAPLRILFVPTFATAPVDPDIAASVAEVAAGFARQGHHVETAQAFDAAEPIAAIWPVISQTGVAWLLARYKEQSSKVGPALAEMARTGAALPATDYLGALDTIARVQRTFDELFERFDLLLIPTAAAMPWPATELYPPIIAGEKVGPRGHAVFTAFANALGLPAINLPCRPAANGLPIGFQLCAARGRDAFLLGVARRWSESDGGSYRWPEVG